MSICSNEYNNWEYFSKYINVVILAITTNIGMNVRLEDISNCVVINDFNPRNKISPRIFAVGNTN